VLWNQSFVELLCYTGEKGYDRGEEVEGEGSLKVLLFFWEHMSGRHLIGRVCVIGEGLFVGETCDREGFCDED
jgi:hypothetical protein